MNIRTEIPETRKLILTVNDDPTMDKKLIEWLRKRGCVALRANSTAWAFELLKKHAVDAIISDLRRDEGSIKNPTAGIEMTRLIRDAGIRIPIMIYTMNVPEPHRKLAKAAGADLISTQPSDLYQWLNSIGI